MRVYLAFLAFVIWMLVSLALAFSIVGLLFIMIYEDEWIEMGKKLYLSITSKFE